jgi:hypothetical protein
VVGTSSAYGEVRAEVPEGAAEVTLTFDDPAFLTVTVTGLDGHPKRSRIRLGLLQGDAPGRHSGAEIPKSGTQKYGPLRPGRYTAYLTMPIGRHDEYPVVATTLDLTSGEATATLEAPKLFRLTAVAEGSPHQNFELYSVAFGWDTFPENAKDGELTWELPAGEYEVRPWGGDVGGPKRVRVPSDSRVVFRKFVPDCFEVVVTGPGAYADAGLRSGDLVVAIDGKALTDQRQMYAVRELAVRKETVPLKILRGGRELSLEVPGATLRGGSREVGGRLKPATRPR